jgi:hypothetical protein
VVAGGTTCGFLLAGLACCCFECRPRIRWCRRWQESATWTPPTSSAEGTGDPERGYDADSGNDGEDGLVQSAVVTEPIKRTGIADRQRESNTYNAKDSAVDQSATTETEPIRVAGIGRVRGRRVRRSRANVVGAGRYRKEEAGTRPGGQPGTMIAQ